ncbi:MAG TPA: BON domain-containing protein [Burkholderiales bacterium]|nr:BON domain-containing protein [Burkholderiales bacterium]
MKSFIRIGLPGFLLVAAAGASVLCPGAIASHWPTGVVHTNAHAAGSARTPDTELAGRVRGALHATFGTAAGEIGVAAQEGFVSLYGEVPSDALRIRAERIASGVAGVRAISNELDVDHNR